MRDLTFTIFESAKSRVGESVSLPWGDWLDVFTTHDVREAPPDAAEQTKDGPAVLLGLVEGTRKKGNVVKIDALSLDVDDVPEVGLAALSKKLRRENVLFVSYSTHKNGLPEAVFPRIRFIVPLSRSVKPDEFEEVRRGFDRFACGLSDPKARDVARLNYLPSSWSRAIKPRVEQNDGAPLDVDYLKTNGKVLPSAPGVPAVRKLLDKAKTRSRSAGDVLAGRPFAWSGDRHSEILSLTMMIANGAGNEVPAEDSVREAFRPSLEAMTELDPTCPSFEELLGAYRGAVEKLGKTYATPRANERAIQLEGIEPYSEAELDTIKQRTGISDLERVWALQKKDSFYLLTGEGNYRGPFSQNEARPAMVEILRRAPVRLWEFTKTGAKKRTIADVVEDHGRVIDEVIVDLCAQTTQFDPRSNTLREAVRPIRIDLVPTFDPEFDAFLNIFGGAQAERLKDWIACVPDCSRLLCALYLSGSPGTGKTSLAHGLARIWQEGPPVEFHRLLGDFNADLCSCPIVLADEHVPLYWKGGSVTKMIRSLVACHERPLARKYLPTATLRGAIRLILASNDDFLLKSTEAMGASDLEAISERFLYIESPEEARRFLEALPADKKERWISRTIAEHSLFLYENRVVKREKRFWVSGSISAFHRLLVQSSDINASVNQWLVYYLQNPAPIDAKGDGLVRRGEGRLLVNDQAVIDGWTTYFPNSRLEPTVGTIGAALRAVSSKERERFRFRGQRVRYRVIDLESLFAWSDASNIGDRETMEASVGLRTRDANVAEITDNIGTLHVGQSPREKIQALKNKTRASTDQTDFEDPQAVDENGDRVPF